MKYQRLVILFFLGALLTVASAARADEQNRKTVFTFQDSVQVPGTVLPAGTYVFKLATSQSDRHIVQIYSQDESRLIATILAIPNSQLEPAGSTILMYAQTPPNEPPALKAWFYPGDMTGQQFIYPKDKARELAAANSTEVPSATATDQAISDANQSSQDQVATAPASSYSTNNAAAEESAPSTPAVESAPAPAQSITPAASPSPSTSNTLPQTASDLPLIGLIGFMAIGGVLVLRKMIQSIL